MTGADPTREATDAELRLVEARITRALTQPAIPRPETGRTAAPLPYLRRHLVDHAAAGGVLDERVLDVEFLPYADADRLRVAAARAQAEGRWDTDRPVRQHVEVFRRAAHRWDWNRHQANAGALGLWSASLGNPEVCDPAGPWHARWARWHVGQGEVLGDPLTGHTGTVFAVATAVLPDGRPVAVTGSGDHTVRVWDLTTGTPIGEPLTGHTGTV